MNRHGSQRYALCSVGCFYGTGAVVDLFLYLLGSLNFTFRIIKKHFLSVRCG
jgi:hypothetical protein